jgi:hypothetical protein
MTSRIFISTAYYYSYLKDNTLNEGLIDDDCQEVVAATWCNRTATPGQIIAHTNHFLYKMDKKYFNVSRKAKISLILGFSPFIIMLIIPIGIAFINNNFGNKQCYLKSIYTNMNFEGVVNNKSYYNNQSCFPIIEIVDQLNSKQRVELFYQKEILWDEINIGDTLKKKGGSLEFYLIGKNGSKDIKIDFDCDDNDFWIDLHLF